MGSFWTPISKPCPKAVQGRAWPPKSSISDQNLPKSKPKATYLSSPFPFSTFVENPGTPTWPQVSQSTFSPFPSKRMGRATLMHFLHVVWGAPMARRQASSIYIYTHEYINCIFVQVYVHQIHHFAMSLQWCCYDLAMVCYDCLWLVTRNIRTHVHPSAFR